MSIIVKKLTGIDSLHRANSFTTGNESHMTLAKAYATGHSNIRTQWFEIELTDVPLFVASQLVRQTQGVQWYQRSKRIDRGGTDFADVCNLYSKIIKAQSANIEEFFEEDESDLYVGNKDTCISNLRATANGIALLPEQFDRLAPTDLFCQINAEALINMARKRLCSKASKETQDIVADIRDLVQECDPDLANHMIRPCVACGLCKESKPCGYITSERYQAERKMYKSLYETKN